MQTFNEKYQVREEILYVIRKHWVAYLKIYLASFFFVLLPPLLILYGWVRFLPFGLHSTLGLATALFLCFYLLFGLLFTYVRLAEEEFDVFLVTPTQLLAINQASFWRRSISSIPLDKIQDTTGLIEGFLPTFFNYGSLAIKTSDAESSPFFMGPVSNPEGVAKRILQVASEQPHSSVAPRAVSKTEENL